MINPSLSYACSACYTLGTNSYIQDSISEEKKEGKKKGKNAKKRVESDSEEEDDPNIFPMKELIARRPQIVQRIFEFLDNKSLCYCRGVTIFWKKFIDRRNLPWKRICRKYYTTERERISNSFYES